jgi:hypothetical protein
MKHQSARRLENQRGFAFVWLALGMTALMGMGAVAIDVSMWYARKGDLQRTADNAALAGGFMLQQGRPVSEAIAKANEIATLNGYSLHLPADPSNPNADANSDIRYPYANHTTWFSVRVQYSEMPYLARVLNHGSQHLEASATSEYQSPIDAFIPPLEYGKSGTTSNYSLFGPKALKANGDRFSPIYEDATLKKNMEHLDDGYDFTIAVPSNYASLNGGKTTMQVELFDPDCYNAATSGGRDALKLTKAADGSGDNTGGAVDEIRQDVTNGVYKETTTQYNLVYTPDDTKIAPTTLATATYSTDTVTDLKWVTPDGFTIDTSLYTAGRLHVQVLSTDGASENGFEIRAGPVHATKAPVIGQVNGVNKTYTMSNVGETAWNAAYKNIVKVGAHGNVPLNFNFDGAVDIALGTVPPMALGGSFTVQRFDTDLTPGNKRVLSYTCDTISSGYTVTLPGNPPEDPNNMSADGGKTMVDTITLDPGYPGGKWTAHYSATSQDTSTWTLIATAPGKDGYLSLVGEAGKLH